MIGFTKYALNYVKNALESYNIGESVSNNVTMLFLKVVSQPIQHEKHNWGINCVASGWGHEMLNKTSKFWPCSIKKIGHANFESFYKFCGSGKMLKVFRWFLLALWTSGIWCGCLVKQELKLEVNLLKVECSFHKVLDLLLIIMQCCHNCDNGVFHCDSPKNTTK